MTRKRISILLLLILVVCTAASACLYIWISGTVGAYTETSQERSKNILSRERLECPNGTTRAEQAWSKAGWSVGCTKNGVRHGPWQAARNGHIVIAGEYHWGRRTGLWKWYDAQGRVVKTINYDESKDPSDQ